MGNLQTQSAVVRPGSGRDQFMFVDGLRAVAALAVATYHAMLFTGRTDSYKAELPDPVRLVLEQGHYGVAAFIVLSGFVLTLPLARGELALRGGWRSYLGRRAWRILPPYYVALAIYTSLIIAIPALRTHQDTAWDSKVPVTDGGLISHLLLVHNLQWEWQGQIDGPMWSVATEWQLYFLLPLLLLPLWRRAGLPRTVVLAVGIGVAIHYLLPSLDGAHFWFLGLFALGMAASQATVTQMPTGRWLVGSAPVLVAMAALQSKLNLPTWLLETTVGVVIALLVVRLAAEPRSVVRRALEWRGMVFVGLFSYSLYLIHSPLLGFGNLPCFLLSFPGPSSSP